MLGLKKKKEEVKKEEKKELVALQAPEKTKIPASINTETEETIFKIERTAPMVLPEIADKTNFDIRYPLIKPYATAHIFWDEKNSELVYLVEEPLLDEKEKKILITLEEGIRELINISFISIKEEGVVIEYLEKNMKVLLDELSVTISKASFLKLMYYIYRDFVGLNEIEPIMSDYFIEDVQCNGLNSPIYVVHRKYRNMRTNVVYTDNMKLSSFVEKIAQKCGKYVSYASPLLDGALPDGSVEYNEPFIYKENGIVKVSKIGEFIDKNYDNDKANTPVKVSHIEVPVFNENYKIEWKPVDYLYRHKNKGKLLKLKLETGREIILTKGHSLFVLNNKGIEVVRTKDLKVGDYTAIPTKVPETEPITEINLIPYFRKWGRKSKTVLRCIPDHVYKEKVKEIKEYLKQNYKKPHQSFYDLKNKNILPIDLFYLLTPKELENTKISTTSHHGIPAILKVDRGLIRLLGYYSAEGWLISTKKHHRIQFCFCSKEEGYIEDVCKAFEKYFCIKPYVEKEKRNSVKITINSILVKYIFEDVLGVTKYAKNKQIPWIIYNVSNELKKEYINAWSNGDYNCTASRKFISDMSYLSLFNEKILSINYRRRAGCIEGRNIVSSEYYSNDIVRNPVIKYTEMIPMEIFNPINKMHKSFSNKRISKNRLKKLLADKRFERLNCLNSSLPKQFFIEWSKRGFIRDNKLSLNGLKALNEKLVLDILTESDLGFAKIKEIKEIDSEHEFVYDVSVPNHENFISGLGGIFCHNSRVNATYTQDISSKGPTFTIRKFTKEPWTPVRLIDFKTASPELLAYLWILIEYESNVMVIGGTGSGKTTFLNALAFFIPPQARIVSIEDTRELNILHENWLPSVARAGSSGSEGAETGHGEITLFDLLRESFRQRPDYVIVGEVRGKEAYVLFQGAASGHPSFSTMHAEDVYTMVRRLETPPINLSPSLVESLDVVCVMTQTKLHDKLVRRLREISEIVKIGERDIANEINTPFTWDPHTDRFFFKMDSKVFDKIVLRHGITREGLNKEFRIRTMLLMKLYQNKIFGFKEVQDIINAYYKTPDKVLKKFNIIV